MYSVVAPSSGGMKKRRDRKGIIVNSYAVNPQDVDGAVTKPYNMDKLIKLIRSLLRRQRWRRVARKTGNDEMIGFDF